jgi:hypothetical protein
MKNLLVLVFIMITATQLCAQFTSNIYATLGTNVGDTLWQTKMSGNVGNKFAHRTWLLRSANGSGWDKTHLVDGISVDNSYKTPQTSRTWWKREAVNGLQFWGDQGNTYMTLNGSRLGIGTSTPVSMLDLNVGTQSTITTGLSVYRNGDPNYGIKLMVGKSDASSYYDWNGGLGSWNGIAFHCTMDNQTRGVFDTRTGNFYVRGVVGSDKDGLFGGNVKVGSDGGNFGLIAGPAFSGAIEIKTNSSTAGADVRHLRLGMQDNNGTFWPSLSINEDLRVGIGTLHPDKLLTVNGTIHSSEVVVDVNVAPDYVFEKSYSLPDLKSVEKYVNENRHLPEIPSAKEMQENGLELKEMNLLLLKKVEELTLYAINQQKQIDDQQKQIDKLKLTVK